VFHQAKPGTDMFPTMSVPSSIEFSLDGKPAGHEKKESCRPKMFVNVGSVGQARHGIAKACYGIIDIDLDVIRANFFEVSYDVKAVQNKLRVIEGCPPGLWNRLEKGL